MKCLAVFFFHQKVSMGPIPNGPRSASCDRAIRYSGLFWVRSIGLVGDFLDFFFSECKKVEEQERNHRPHDMSIYESRLPGLGLQIWLKH